GRRLRRVPGWWSPSHRPRGQSRRDVARDQRRRYGPLIDRIRANADLVVRQLGPDSGIPNFGFNIASIEWLDGFIERQRSRPDVDDRFVDRLVNIIGSFLGECMVRHYGARW